MGWNRELFPWVLQVFAVIRPARLTWAFQADFNQLRVFVLTVRPTTFSATRLGIPPWLLSGHREFVLHGITPTAAGYRRYAERR